MAGKRDFLDDIIDIREDLSALSKTGDNLVNSLGITDEEDEFIPSDYKERPRANSTYCSSAVTKNPEACKICVDLCPSHSIVVTGAQVRIRQNCRKCGICAAACPTEVFVLRNNAPLALYDKVAKIASAYEQCYITCTRALRRKPQANEVLLPCVGAIAKEVWFDLLCDFDNLVVYLPYGVCDKCRTTTGEEFFSEQIALAEEWSGESVGLVMDEREFTRELKRAYKRTQFVSSVTQSATRLVTRATPLAGAQAVAARLQEHSKQITDLQKTLDAAVGSNTASKRRRLLTRRRKLVMAGLQKYPDLAEEMYLPFPEVDVDRCSMCGDCTKVCTVHALEMDADGRVVLEPSYCVNCGVCERVCTEGAIRMVKTDAEELVVIDEKQVEEREKQRKRSKSVREKGKETLTKGLNYIESLADEDDEEE